MLVCAGLRWGGGSGGPAFKSNALRLTPCAWARTVEGSESTRSLVTWPQWASNWTQAREEVKWEGWNPNPGGPDLQVSAREAAHAPCGALQILFFLSHSAHEGMINCLPPPYSGPSRAVCCEERTPQLRKPANKSGEKDKNAQRRALNRSASTL